MRRHVLLAAVAVAALGALPLSVSSAQSAPGVQAGSPSVEVRWIEATDGTGRRQVLPVFLEAPPKDLLRRAREVIKVDEDIRVAKLAKDVGTLERLFSDSLIETNQNGNSRDKKALLELWASFPITSLATERASVRLSDRTAIVSGEQTEVNGSGTDRMLFTRVYVETPSGWQLLSSTQFRNPRAGALAEAKR